MEWFRHDSNANLDEKLQEVLLDYGLEGYGLYWYCIELIVGKTSADNITFELKHDARVIARNTNSTPQKVEEMMKRFIALGLFENEDNKITCLKVAKRLMSSATSNPKMRGLIQDIKIQYDTALDTNRHDAIMTPSDFITAEENRIEEKRLDKKEKTKYIPPIPAELLSEWLAVRKKKRAGDMTELVWNALLREASKLNWSSEQAVTYCCEKSWVNLDAKWVKEPSVKPMKGYGFISDEQFNEWLDPTSTHERIVNE